MTGCGALSIDFPSRPPSSENPLISSPLFVVISAMSAPATKALSPPPVRRTTPTSFRRARPSKACVSSSRSAEFSAFTGGRSIVTRAMRSPTSRRTKPVMVTPPRERKTGHEPSVRDEPHGTPRGGESFLKTRSIGSLGSFLPNMPGEEWFRTSDLSPVKMAFTFMIVAQTFTVTVTYNPPIAIQWPLAASASWSASSVVTAVQEVTGQPPTITMTPVLETFRVEADEQKTVPAGTFTATPLVETPGGAEPAPYTKSYWSRDAGNQVEQKSYDPNDAETGGMELKSYRHVAPGAGGGPSGGVLGLPPIIWALFLVVLVIVVIAAVG